MKKIVLLLVVVIGLGFTTKAQDVITLKNGTDINALVQKIGEAEIVYKKFDNPNGPNYTLKKSEILMVRYENGTKDIFSEESNSSTNTEWKPFSLKKSDKIAINTYAMRDLTKKTHELLQEKLKNLGFCCVYKKTDKNDRTANNVIVVHPTDFLSGVHYFKIFDGAQEILLFEVKYTKWHLEKMIDKFINDITPFIEE